MAKVDLHNFDEIDDQEDVTEGFDEDSKQFDQSSKNDDNRFTDLFDEHRVGLYDFLIRMCAEEHSVLQIMHEVLETLIRDLPAETSDRDFVVTLFKTCRSFAAHIWKTSTPSLIPPEGIDRKSTEYLVQREILTLHKREKEVICLKWMLGFSWTELGEILEYDFDEERKTRAEAVFEDFCSRLGFDQEEIAEAMPVYTRYATPEATRYITQAVSKAISGIVKNRRSSSKRRVFHYVAFAAAFVLIYGFAAEYTEGFKRTIGYIWQLLGF